MADEAGEIGQSELSARDIDMARRSGLGSENLARRKKLNEAIIDVGGELETHYYADLTLETFRNREESRDSSDVTQRPNIHDLATYFSAKRKDTTKRFQDKHDRYDRLYLATEALENHESIGKDVQEEIAEEIENEIKGWRRQSIDQSLPQDARDIAEGNYKVFARIRNDFYRIINPGKEPIDPDQPMSQDESEELMKEFLPAPEDFKQKPYDIIRENIRTVRESVADEAKNITFEQMTDYYTAVANDAREVEGDYEKSAKWRIRKAVAQGAAKFLAEQGGRTKHYGKEIIVSVKPDGSFGTASWDTPTDYAKVYKLKVDRNFNPLDETTHDPESLSYVGYFAEDVDRLLIDSLPPAMDALKKVKARQSITGQEKLVLYRLVQLFAGDKDLEMRKFLDDHVKVDDAAPGLARRVLGGIGSLRKKK